jgi:hypothetical protein
LDGLDESGGLYAVIERSKFAPNRRAWARQLRPQEFVPGTATLVPSAPPPEIDMCDPMPPPRANAACENTRQAAKKRNEPRFMVHTPRVAMTCTES